MIIAPPLRHKKMMSLCPVVVVAVALLTLSVGQQVHGGKFDVENGEAVRKTASTAY